MIRTITIDDSTHCVVSRELFENITDLARAATAHHHFIMKGYESDVHARNDRIISDADAILSAPTATKTEATKRKAVKDIDRKLAAYRRTRFDRTQKMRRKQKKANAP